MEISFIDGPIGHPPLTLQQVAFKPIPDQFDINFLNNISALAVLEPISPLARVPVFVGEHKKPITAPFAVSEIAIIIPLVNIAGFANAMLLIGIPRAVISIAVGVGQNPTAMSPLNFTFTGEMKRKVTPLTKSPSYLSPLV
jgi:hypothetical protein